MEREEWKGTCEGRMGSRGRKGSSGEEWDQGGRKGSSGEGRRGELVYEYKGRGFIGKDQREQ